MVSSPTYIFFETTLFLPSFFAWYIKSSACLIRESGVIIVDGVVVVRLAHFLVADVLARGAAGPTRRLLEHGNGGGGDGG